MHRAGSRRLGSPDRTSTVQCLLCEKQWNHGRQKSSLGLVGSPQSIGQSPRQIALRALHSAAAEISTGLWPYQSTTNRGPVLQLVLAATAASVVLTPELHPGEGLRGQMRIRKGRCALPKPHNPVTSRPNNKTLDQLHYEEGTCLPITSRKRPWSSGITGYLGASRKSVGSSCFQSGWSGPAGRQG